MGRLSERPNERREDHLSTGPDEDMQAREERN